MNIDENGYIIEPEELNQEYESSRFLIITYEVLADNRLTDFQKLLFSAITGLCRQNGYCWASNAYFEKFFNKGQSQVSNGISKLVELGYLKREMVYKRKQEKSGKIIVTKQISYRKLFVVLDTNHNTPIMENHNTPILENHKQIYNPIINNISNNNTNVLLLGEQDNSPINNNENNNINNINDCIDDVLVEDNLTKSSEAASEPPKPKRKGGLAPLIDEIENTFNKKQYPELNQKLNTYLHCYIGCRKLPSLEKWKGMMQDLINYSSINLPGTLGKKLNTQVAIQIVEKAINGKDGAPFTEFDDIYHYGSNNNVMEPHFNLNQDFTKGY
ncbi:MAG: helix-turn-helix domain-containing protein [Romboutsia timonensis]